MKHVFKVLVIDPDPVQRRSMSFAARLAAAGRVVCLVESINSFHHAVHLLRGYERTSLPHLIVMRDHVDQEETAFSSQEWCCREFLECGIHETLRRMGLNIPVAFARSKDRWHLLREICSLEARRVAST